MATNDANNVNATVEQTAPVANKSFAYKSFDDLRNEGVITMSRKGYLNVDKGFFKPNPDEPRVVHTVVHLGKVLCLIPDSMQNDDIDTILNVGRLYELQPGDEFYQVPGYCQYTMFDTRISVEDRKAARIARQKQSELEAEQEM